MGNLAFPMYFARATIAHPNIRIDFQAYFSPCVQSNPCATTHAVGRASIRDEPEDYDLANRKRFRIGGREHADEKLGNSIAWFHPIRKVYSEPPLYHLRYEKARKKDMVSYCKSLGRNMLSIFIHFHYLARNYLGEAIWSQRGSLRRAS